MTCADTTMSLGVYVLGALEPAEQARVEAHLTTCADCRTELDALAALPAMLDRLSLEDLAVEPPTVPDDLFDRVAARARADADREEQSSPRADSRLTGYRRLTAVAAAVVLVAGASVGADIAFRHHSSGSTAAAESPETRVGTRGTVQMKVQLAAQTSGTGIRITVSGLPNDEHCRLIAIAKDGTRDVAGRWDATYEGQAQETGSTAIARNELSQLVLFGTGGRQLVVVAI